VRKLKKVVDLSTEEKEEEEEEKFESEWSGGRMPG
jgi:hypothetical protein